MLPDDPVVRGRLLWAARDLLGWTQARVAGEAGISTAAVTAREVGRRGPRAGSVAAITAALERAGARFLAAADGLGHGVRYERPEPASTGARPPELHLVPGVADTGRRSPACPGSQPPAPTNCVERCVTAQLRSR